MDGVSDEYSSHSALNVNIFKIMTMTWIIHEININVSMHLFEKNDVLWGMRTKFMMFTADLANFIE